MSKFLRGLRVSLLVVAMFFSAWSCGGSGTNNDQGTSFTALGFYGSSDGTTGETGSDVPLFVDSAPQTTFQIYDMHTVMTYIGLQNRLSKQFIRVTKIECSYDITGASVTIPDDSFNYSTVIEANGIAYSGFEIVSPDIMAYLNANINYLPQLPFRMIVTCEATGVTQAGDVMVTNPVSYLIQFADVAECCTGATGEAPGGSGGFQQGTGTGGDIDWTDGGASSSTASQEIDTSTALSSSSSSVSS